MKKEGWFTDGCEIYKTNFKDHSLSQRINILLKEGKGVKSPFFFVSDRFQNLQKSSGGEKSNLQNKMFWGMNPPPCPPKIGLKRAKSFFPDRFETYTLKSVGYGPNGKKK